MVQKRGCTGPEQMQVLRVSNILSGAKLGGGFGALKNASWLQLAERA